MAFIYARSDDVGAFTLTGEVGKIKALLKAYLVDGYGGHASVGWTMPFEDVPGNMAVFRPAAGNRPFLHVDDNGSSSRGARVAVVSAFKSMIGVQLADGVGAFNDNTKLAYIGKSSLLSAAATPWILIATDKWFWFSEGSVYYKSPTVANLVDTSECCYTFFGDYQSVGNDQNSSALLCGYDSSATSTSARGLNTSSDTISPKNCPGNASGVIAPQKLYSFAESMLAANTPGFVWGSNYQGLPNPQLLSSDTHFCRLMIGDASSTVQIMRDNLRGYMPGILIPCVKVNPPLFSLYTINNKNYINIGIMKTSNNISSLLINTDGTDL